MVARRRGTLLAAVLMLTAAPLLGAAEYAAATDGDSLRLLLLGAQDMNTPQTLLRADITLEVETPKSKHTTDAIALFAPGTEARWYLQLREPALRALVLGAERKVMERSGTITQTIAIGAPIDDLEIAYEDLSRFIASDFKTWQITDESPATILVGMHPAVESAYVYRAYTIDKEKTLLLHGQFYAKTLNNLVKRRVDADHVLVGKKRLPGTITIENYPDNSTTRLKLRWSQAASAPPELLAPASFPGAAPLAWDAATGTATNATPATSPSPPPGS